MSLIKLYIKTENQKYPIFIGNNILNKLKNIKQLSLKCRKESFLNTIYNKS